MPKRRRSQPQPGNRRVSRTLLGKELKEARQVAYMLKTDLDRALVQRNLLGILVALNAAAWAAKSVGLL